jgi:hypothetical protein
VNKLIIVLLAALLLIGCTEELGDRESDAGRKADAIEDVYSVTVYRNIDRFPNVAMFCLEGLGFAATSRGSSSAPTSSDFLRVPEYDSRCAR